MPLLATWPALARLRTHHDRFPDPGPRAPDLFGQVEHPGLQPLIVLQPVPRPVPEHDVAVRRSHTEPLLIEEEVHTHLGAVRESELEDRLPFLGYGRVSSPDEPARPSGQAQPPRGERYPVEREGFAAAKAATQPHAPTGAHQP